MRQACACIASEVMVVDGRQVHECITSEDEFDEHDPEDSPEPDAPPHLKPGAHARLFSR